jgi:uncharacterized protein
LFDYTLILHRGKKYFLSTVLFSFWGILTLVAQIVPENKLPPRPNPPRLVVDYADLLTTAEEAELERKLVAYDNATSNQILIVTVRSTKGYEADQYATEIGQKWGVGGQAKMDNGVVILVSDGTEEENNRRKAFIATGYGLEGTLNAITTKWIVDKYLIPNLKLRNYFQAFDETTDAVSKTIAGEYKAPEGYANRGKGGGTSIITIIFIALIILFILSRIGGGGGGGGMMSRRGYKGWNNVPPIIWFPGGGGGGGGGSSGGGGGFGGFGGGGFGGGGAGGDW